MFYSLRVSLFLFLPLLCLLSGCDFQAPEKVDQLKIVQGENQCALPGQPFAKVLRVELLGANRPGMFGGSGSRMPVPGVRVRFIPEKGSLLTANPEVAVSDAGGVVSSQITAGNIVGDQYLEIVPENAPAKKIRVRFVSGMEITGINREYKAGEIGSEPVRVKIIGPKGKPEAGIPVYFRFASTPEGKKSSGVIENSSAVTDAQGIAQTNVRLGKKTGEYNIGIEVASPERGVFIREQQIRLLGLNWIAVVIAVLGGLALFVFGMQLMSDGIQKVAGENMKKVLQFFARNGIVAVLAGALVTAVIQSSSATTVMVIGFINAGLLSLQQSIGIIFGANIGTTITAQIISFNLSGVVMPAITIGFLITLCSNRMLKGWGETVLGFGLLFFGMELMSGELRDLGTLPSFVNFFRTFDCRPVSFGGFMPIGAVTGAICIGVIATVLIQSSSAAMGIVLALAGSGLVNFYTAVPLLIGTNIGTTITAMIAALPANRVAKQAALAHTMFNIFGAAIMVVLFYVPFDKIPVFLYFVNAITPGDVFAAIPQNIERHVAMAHTLFNVAVVIVLLPFIGAFARFCNWLLPIPADSQIMIQQLEPHLLATPSVALEQSIGAIRKMVKDAWIMIDSAVNEHFLDGDLSEKKIAALQEAESKIDEAQSEITAYLVKITRRQLTDPQSELVPLLMHCTNDAERIADHAENIVKLAERMSRSEKRLSSDGKKELKKMWDELQKQEQNVIAALGSDNPETIRFALKNERKINKMADKYEEAHIERLRKGQCTMNNGIIFIEMLGELEKIGDHLSNIAERTPEIQNHYVAL